MKLLGFAVILAAVTTIMAAIPNMNRVSGLEPGPVKKSSSLKISDASSYCIFCEIVMGELDVLINEESSEEEVENALDDFCTLLPPDDQQKCQYFAHQYTPAIVRVLSQGIKPSMACKALKFCKAPKPEKPECYWCKYVMGKTQSLLVATSEEDVLGTLGKICTFFPAEVKTKCTYFIKAYGKIGLDVLIKQTPEQICKDFGQCTSSIKKEVPWRKILSQ